MPPIRSSSTTSQPFALDNLVTKSVIGLLKNLQIPLFHVKSILTRNKKPFGKIGSDCCKRNYVNNSYVHISRCEACGEVE